MFKTCKLFTAVYLPLTINYILQVYSHSAQTRTERWSKNIVCLWTKCRDNFACVNRKLIADFYPLPTQGAMYIHKNSWKYQFFKFGYQSYVNVAQLSVLKHAAKNQYYNYVVQNVAEEGFLGRIFGLKGCKTEGWTK